MKKYYYLLFLSFISVFANIQSSFATHIQAADIMVVRDPNDAKKYTFTLFVYFDATKVIGNGGISTDFATLDFGDKTNQTVSRAKLLETVGTNVVKGTYIFTHQYKLLGNYYIGYTEFNRVDGVLNMNNSVNTPLYIESMISIQPFLGVNDSPILTIPPIDNANSGELYTYNTGAYDPNGDSLSFEIIPTQQSVGKNVDQYTNPNDPKFGGKALGGGSPTFVINPKTGDLTWDSPGQAGVYNIAIKVTEYRDGVRVGYVIRDMQIVVKDGKNKPPKLFLANDSCYVANGSQLLFDIGTFDPDNNQVATNAYGALISKNVATFISNTKRTSPSLTQIVWSPTCGDAQDQPYQFNLMAQDYPTNGAPLYDFKTLSVKLNAPKPQNFKVLAVAKTAQLSWDVYGKTCNAAKFKDSVKAVVEIYRQECDSLFTNNDCNMGKSGNLSGKLIASIPITDSIFVDDNNGKGLKAGTKYFYSIKPRSFDKSKGGGAAIAAAPVGIIISKNLPLIKTISVLETGVNGKIKVEWGKPYDSTGLTAPYSYKLMKASGLNSTNFTTISTITSNHLLDTFYVDSNVNTVDSSYLYKIIFSANALELGETESGSNILLTSKASDQKVSIEAQYKSIYTFSHFNVYNAKTGAFIKQQKSQSDSLTSIDITGLINCDTICFKVEAVGKYCISKVNDTLENISQTICDLPRVGSKPIVQINIENSICDNNPCLNSFPNAPYQNKIYWEKPNTPACDVPKGYNVYYAENNGANFTKVANVEDTLWMHTNLANFAGCYYVKTINFNNEESEASNIVCQDICPCFELPNIVTPNADSLNDLFKPLYPPRFVETVSFKVVNRWGDKVYESNDINDIYIRWDSSALSDGVYFYEAEVTFSNRAKTSDRKKTFKGWVQVAR